MPISISIITPCYNGGRFVADTINSVLAQTRLPLEILVIDDGSTDDSAAIAERFGPPVRVIRQANQGESVARNRGIAQARGTHVLFLDADDLLAPEALAVLTEALEGKPDAVAVMGCAWFTSDRLTPSYVKDATHRAFYPSIIEQNIAPPHCWLTPRHLLNTVGGFCETMRWFEDWDLWWRVGLHASELIPVPYIGAEYRQHPASQLATTTPADRARGHVALVCRMAVSLLDRPDVLAHHGKALYWSVWSALVHAQKSGVPSSELAALRIALEGIARRGPSSVRSIRSARVVRWLGVRTAVALQRYQTPAAP